MAGGLAFRRGRIRSAWGQAIRLPGTGWGGARASLWGMTWGDSGTVSAGGQGAGENGREGGARLRKKGDEGRRMGGRR